MSNLRWGIVGCGDVVEKKSGPSILAGNRSRIVAVMRRDLARLEPFASRAGAAVRTDDADAVIHCPGVDIVYVATPPRWHLKHVLAAAAAGRHVLVEKPMGLNAGESQAMVEACQRAGVELFAAYYRRFQPHVREMRRLVDSGAIGRLLHGQVEFAMPYQPGRDWGWRTDPGISGGGLFADILSHRIDLLIHFFGEPASVHGASTAFHPDASPEDLATVLVQFKSGAQATCIGNFAAAKLVDRLVLTGTDGEILTDHLDGHAFTLTHAGQTQSLAFQPYPAPHTGLVLHIEQVLAGEAKNGVPGSDGCLTDRVLDLGLRARSPRQPCP